MYFNYVLLHYERRTYLYRVNEGIILLIHVVCALPTNSLTVHQWPDR